MENPENLSPEELAAKKRRDVNVLYKESMPYLEAQLKYETNVI